MKTKRKWFHTIHDPKEIASERYWSWRNTSKAGNKLKNGEKQQILLKWMRQTSCWLRRNSCLTKLLHAPNVLVVPAQSIANIHDASVSHRWTSNMMPSDYVFQTDPDVERNHWSELRQIFELTTRHGTIVQPISLAVICRFCSNFDLFSKPTFPVFSPPFFVCSNVLFSTLLTFSWLFIFFLSSLLSLLLIIAVVRCICWPWIPFDRICFIESFSYPERKRKRKR